MKSVIIYTTPTCHFCHAAKDFFAEHGIVFTEKDAARDEAARAEAVAKSGQMGVPVIDVAGDIVVGFDEPKLRALLAIA